MGQWPQQKDGETLLKYGKFYVPVWYGFMGKLKEDTVVQLIKAATITVVIETVAMAGVNENRPGVFREAIKDRWRVVELVRSWNGVVEIIWGYMYFYFHCEYYYGA